MRIVVGTTNRKKRDEILELLDLPGLRLLTLSDFADYPEVIEDAHTFAGNAAKKAGDLAKALDHWVLGEDSGLCVDALGGRPGVYSARYAGEPCDDEANNRKLLAELATTPADRRQARYVCSIAVADPGGNIRAVSEGECHGRIAFEPSGTGGFGYDPLFIFGNGEPTFGSLPAEVKRKNSHRANAVAKLRPKLAQILDLHQAGASFDEEPNSRRR